MNNGWKYAFFLTLGVLLVTAALSVFFFAKWQKGVRQQWEAEALAQSRHDTILYQVRQYALYCDSVARQHVVTQRFTDSLTHVLYSNHLRRLSASDAALQAELNRRFNDE